MKQYKDEKQSVSALDQIDSIIRDAIELLEKSPYNGGFVAITWQETKFKKIVDKVHHELKSHILIFGKLELIPDICDNGFVFWAVVYKHKEHESIATKFSYYFEGITKQESTPIFVEKDNGFK